MIRVLFAALAVLATGALAPADAAAQASGNLRIAYLRSQEIMASAPGRANAEAQFEREMSTYRTQVQRMGDSLNALMADYEKQSAVLSPAAKEGKEKELRAKQEDYQNRVRQMEQQAAQRQGELVQPLIAQIQQIIEAVRKEDGYALVFDATSQGGALVAADSSLDITQKVIARLKAAPPVATRPAGAQQRPAGAARPSGPALPAPAGATRPNKPPTR
ncbi:MAG TPA: OmpH family outer membrane protein [Gemmatimonadaceae bacterium]|nr:OmpH family outer membrane protein [Gemmatimonadaceae bacterium]